MAELSEARADKDILSPAELREAVGGLSDADHYRLRKKVAVFLAGSRGMDPDDLFHSAIIRALGGSRKCPRNVKIMVFLANIMKSIVFAYWKSTDVRRTDRGAAAEDKIALLEDPAAANAEVDLIATDLRKKQVDVLFKLFEDDEDATLFLMARMETESMSETAAACGFDSTKADTVRRRIRRKVEQEYPEGLRP